MTKIRKVLTTMANVALSLCSYAADITLDGMCYNLLDDGTLKVVAANSSSSGGAP